MALTHLWAMSFDGVYGVLLPAQVLCTFLYGFALGPLFPGAILVAEASKGRPSIATLSRARATCVFGRRSSLQSRWTAVARALPWLARPWERWSCPCSRASASTEIMAPSAPSSAAALLPRLVELSGWASAARRSSSSRRCEDRAKIADATASDCKRAQASGREKE